jgi:L-rhamnose-H+ transport protein
MSIELLVLTGLLLVSIGGFVDGSLGLVLKYTRVWKWEHLWLVYSGLAFGVIPWIVGWATVGDLMDILQRGEGKVIAQVFLFGLGWGCGAVLYGLALKAAGMALSYAIVMGLTAAVGSLAPLVLLHAEEIYSFRGLVIIAGVLLVVVGVLFCAQAGHLKERALSSSANQVASPIGQKPMLGVIIAVFSGIFSPMINLSFTYGAPLSELATSRGTTSWFAPMAIWVIALSAGAVVNCIYCAYLISKKHTWHLMSRLSFDHLLGLIMGLLGPVALIFYGMGSTQMGDLGAVSGWPIMSAMGILGANFWGAVTGEWTGTGKRPIRLMGIAVTALIAALFLLGWSSTLG